MVRIAPHANWDPRSAGAAYERGYFVASLNPDGETWDIGLNTSQLWSWSTKYVKLGEGEFASTITPVTSTTTDFLVTLRWTLQDAPDGTAYDALQDQGVAIALVDEDGIQSPWQDNMHSSCGEVFHTSYPPVDAGFGQARSTKSGRRAPASTSPPGVWSIKTASA